MKVLTDSEEVELREALDSVITELTLTSEMLGTMAANSKSPAFVERVVGRIRSNTRAVEQARKVSSRG